MSKIVFITGGAGFIGINCAKYFIEKGDKVYIFDNLSRIGTRKNLKWLKTIEDYEFIKGDIVIKEEVDGFFKNSPKPDYIFHFAAQVAVTTSVENPRKDLMDNILGTFNMLEAARQYAPESIFLFSSTNKVYGDLGDEAVEETEKYYKLKDLKDGISENVLLNFYSPYGCSKGAADQYVRDYGRIYNLKTIVFRQSCIYGYRQFGVEDQGWVAWFIISALKDRKITIYGNGKQVRDILFIDDLIACFSKAIENIDITSGQIYNIGGGPDNQISLLIFLEKLEKMLNKKLDYSFSDWRPGDQLIYVSDIRKAKEDFGWQPTIGADEGIQKLIDWMKSNFELFR